MSHAMVPYQKGGKWTGGTTWDGTKWTGGTTWDSTNHPTIGIHDIIPSKVFLGTGGTRDWWDYMGQYQPSHHRYT